MAQRKLYLFGIGGTGSRIIKSLTFLLAAGVQVKGYTIVPIIIDPDRSNHDLERTIQILNEYQKVHKTAKRPTSGFFATPITTLRDIQAEQQDNSQNPIPDGFQFDIDGTRDDTLRDFVQFNDLTPNSQKMMQLLFGDQLLSTKLGKGFYGNPNIGSIVLNQFKDSSYFKAFASQFTAEDRIFVVSSIFGGTGAAGFPLLVKTIRQADKANLPNSEYLKNASVGALTMLPYFGVEPDGTSRIEKGTFISKTKAALSYYGKGINQQITSLYYLGDLNMTDYPNQEGGSSQRNNAHFLELVGALSILDFLHDDELQTRRTTYKEYAIRENTSDIHFPHLADETMQDIFRPLTQYTYCCKYWKEHLSNAVEQQAWSKGKGGNANVPLDHSFFNGDFFKNNLMRFNAHYLDWLQEMGRQNRSFAPFDLNVGSNFLHNMVRGIEQRKTGNFLSKKVEWDYSLFDDALNTAEKSMSETEPAKKCMDLFFQASKDIFQRKFA